MNAFTSSAKTASPSGPFEFDREVEERFLRYAQIDTQSDEQSPTSPSTKKQLDLLTLLAEELTSIGAHRRQVDRLRSGPRDDPGDGLD